jgi:hypothetical protein
MDRGHTISPTGRGITRGAPTPIRDWRCGANTEYLGGLIGCESSEIAELDKPALPLIEFCQRKQGFIYFEFRSSRFGIGTLAHDRLAHSSQVLAYRLRIALLNVDRLQ